MSKPTRNKKRKPKTQASPPEAKALWEAAFQPMIDDIVLKIKAEMKRRQND